MSKNVFIVLAVILALFSSIRADHVETLNGQGCALCHLLVNQVKDVAEEYKGEITDEFQKLACSKLPDSAQGLCKTFVKEYGPRVIDFLVQKADTDAICRRLGLCDQTEWVREMITDREAFQIFAELQAQLNDYPNCAMCKFIVGEIESYANKSEEEIEHQLVALCKKLPGQLEQLCDTLVLLYFKELFDYVLEKETPPVACAQVHLCPPPSQPEPVVVEEVTSQDNDNKCSLCTYVVGLLEEWVQNNRTEENIRHALEKVCKKLGPFSSTCQAFVDQYADKLVEYLLQKLPPKEICQKIGLCPKQQIVVEEIKVVEPVPENDGSCDLCVYIAGLAEEFLKNNATEEKIRNFLHNVCNRLPFSQQCQQFVDQYEHQLVEYLLQKLPPKELCQKIGLCPKKIVADENNCELCKFTVSLVEHALANNETIAQIEQRLEHSCSLLPDTYKGMCISFFREYTEEIIHYLTEKYDPKAICVLANMCPSKEIDVSKKVFVAKKN